MASLNHQEVQLVINVYDEVVNLMLSRLVGKELDNIIAFHNKVVLTLSPWQLSNKKAIEMLSEEVFNDEETRNYVLDVYTMLMFKLGGGEEFKKKLIETFANSALIETRMNIENTSIPKELHSYIIPKEGVMQYLTYDSWMIVIKLMFYTGLKKVVNENT